MRFAAVQLNAIGNIHYIYILRKKQQKLYGFLSIFPQNLPHFPQKEVDLSLRIENRWADAYGSRFQCSGSAMSQGRTVQPCPHGDLPPGQLLPDLLTIHPLYAEGQHSRLTLSCFIRKDLHTRQPCQPFLCPPRQPPLPLGNPLHPGMADKPEPLQ